jgi:IS5 family transposase
LELCGLGARRINDRIVQIAAEQKVVQGRKMRIDTTVLESNIHYPTDSSLLGDGVRVLTCSMHKTTQLVGASGTKLRDQSRSVAGEESPRPAGTS